MKREIDDDDDDDEREHNESATPLENYHTVQPNVMDNLLRLSERLDNIHTHMNNIIEFNSKNTPFNSNHLRKKRETVNNIENVIQVLKLHTT